MKDKEIRNILIPKKNLVNPTDIDFAIFVHLSQVCKYDSWKILSVSVCNFDTENFMVVVLLDQIVHYQSGKQI